MKTTSNGHGIISPPRGERRTGGGPRQGLTLHVSDSIGVPLEFCATMEPRERMFKQYHRYRGACAQRLDHYQLQASNVRTAFDFYQRMGFRTSEYTV